MAWLRKNVEEFLYWFVAHVFSATELSSMATTLALCPDESLQDMMEVDEILNEGAQISV